MQPFAAATTLLTTNNAEVVDMQRVRNNGFNDSKDAHATDKL